MTKRTPNFARVLAAGGGEDAGPLRGPEIDAVIELAYLMANADGQASLDELDSLKALVKYLKPEATLGALLDELGARLEKAESLEDRVRAAASILTRTAARELAYKAVYTIAVFDLETNAAERDLDDLLVQLLGLSDRVDELEHQANDALVT